MNQVTVSMSEVLGPFLNSFKYTDSFMNDTSLQCVSQRCKVVSAVALLTKVDQN